MAAERITQRTLNSAVLNNLQGNLARMQKLQEQMSSGRAIRRPSDSPADTVSALRYRADIRRSEQIQRNATDGLGWLGTADTSLTQMYDVIRRVRSLALQGVNAATSANDREALAAEVETLREHALTLANTTYLDRPVFAGAAATSLAFDPTTGAYQGDGAAVNRTIAPGASVQVNLDGRDIFGPDGANLFDVISSVADDLRNNVTDLAPTDVAALDTASVRLGDALATVGARYAQVETMRNRTDANLVEQANGLAEVESIDLPKTIVDLQLQEVAYKAALAAGARVLQPSLVDFLR